MLEYRLIKSKTALQNFMIIECCSHIEDSRYNCKELTKTLRFRTVKLVFILVVPWQMG